MVTSKDIQYWSKVFARDTKWSQTVVAEQLMDMFQQLEIPFEPVYISDTGEICK